MLFLKYYGAYRPLAYLRICLRKACFCAKGAFAAKLVLCAKRLHETPSRAFLEHAETGMFCLRKLPSQKKEGAAPGTGSYGIWLRMPSRLHKTVRIAFAGCDAVPLSYRPLHDKCFQLLMVMHLLLAIKDI